MSDDLRPGDRVVVLYLPDAEEDFSMKEFYRLAPPGSVQVVESFNYGPACANAGHLDFNPYVALRGVHPIELGDEAVYVGPGGKRTRLKSPKITGVHARFVRKLPPVEVPPVALETPAGAL